MSATEMLDFSTSYTINGAGQTGSRVELSLVPMSPLSIQPGGRTLVRQLASQAQSLAAQTSTSGLVRNRGIVFIGPKEPADFNPPWAELRAAMYNWGVEFTRAASGPMSALVAHSAGPEAHIRDVRVEFSGRFAAERDRVNSSLSVYLLFGRAFVCAASRPRRGLWQASRRVGRSLIERPDLFIEGVETPDFHDPTPLLAAWREMAACAAGKADSLREMVEQLPDTAHPWVFGL